MLRTFLSLIAAAALVVAAAPVASAQPAKAGPPAASRKMVTGTININTAPAVDLQKLPGVGAKTAARIIEYRQKNGPFKKIEELMNVRGVGEKNFLKLKPLITVAAKPERVDQP